MGEYGQRPVLRILRNHAKWAGVAIFLFLMAYIPFAARAQNIPIPPVDSSYVVAVCGGGVLTSYYGCYCPNVCYGSGQYVVGSDPNADEWECAPPYGECVGIGVDPNPMLGYVESVNPCAVTGSAFCNDPVGWTEGEAGYAAGQAEYYAGVAEGIALGAPGFALWELWQTTGIDVCTGNLGSCWAPNPPGCTSKIYGGYCYGASYEPSSAVDVCTYYYSNDESFCVLADWNNQSPECALIGGVGSFLCQYALPEAVGDAQTFQGQVQQIINSLPANPIPNPQTGELTGACAPTDPYLPGQAQFGQNCGLYDLEYDTAVSAGPYSLGVNNDLISMESAILADVLGLNLNPTNDLNEAEAAGGSAINGSQTAVDDTHLEVEFGFSQEHEAYCVVLHAYNGSTCPPNPLQSQSAANAKASPPPLAVANNAIALPLH